MIDWLTACIPLPPEQTNRDFSSLVGYTLYAKPGGEVEKVVPSWLEIKGSFEAGIRMRITHAGLWISGNPIKWLSGQNVDGPDDAGKLLGAILPACLAAASLPCSIATEHARLTRVDCTESFDLGAIERVRELLRVMALGARARNQGRSHSSYQTIYLGKHSRRHAIKMYAKGDELSYRSLPAMPDDVAQSIRDQAAGLFRVEVTLRSKELEQIGHSSLDAWTADETSRMLWSRYWSRVEVSGMVELASDEVLALPRRLRMAYELWAAGRDCYELMSRNTYYTKRRELLHATQGRCDIAMLRPRVETADLDTTGILDYFKTLAPWKSSGRLAEWIRETAA